VRLDGVPLRQAVTMASLNPARAAGVARAKGTLEPGKDGDVVVLDDDLAVRAVVVAGQVVYSR
ncbi:MAG: amidohydrolase family protein, partial [Limnochordales bacterium]